jgi:predicted CoA-binding protein
MTMQPNICEILDRYRTIAVVGLSPKPERDSHRVARFLKEHGYRIIPVNPGQKEILGEKCYPALSEIPEPVEIVDVFRRPEAIPEIADEAVRIGAKVFWMQLGIRHDEAAKKLAESGIEVIMDRCIKIELVTCEGL